MRQSVVRRFFRPRNLISAPRAIFVLALAVGLFQAFDHPTFGLGTGWETVAIAKELVHSGVYGNPFRVGPSGATAIIAPLFPLYLAILIKLLGVTPAFSLAATVAALFAQAVQASLLPRVSMLFFGRASPGILAGVLSAFSFRLMPQWDAAFVSCGVLLFVLNGSPLTWRATAIAGVAAGLLLLTNPSTILITGPWMVYLCRRLSMPLTRVAGFAIVAVLIALPWMLRDYSALGTFSIKDNFGMTAHASNNDCAKSSLAASIANGCYDSVHPNTSVEELRALNRVGETRYNGIRTADTLRWVHSHRGSFVRLTADRVLEFWFPPAEAAPLYSTFAIWAATGLSVPGLILLAYRRRPVSLYVIAVAAIYPLMYYVVVSDVRYRLPVLWLSLLCGGYLLNDVARVVTCFFHRPLVLAADRGSGT